MYSQIELINKVARRTMEWNFRVWGFGEAIALRGLLRAAEVGGDAEPRGFVRALLRTYIGRGVARSNEDHVAPGPELVTLYEQTGDDVYLDAARRLADLHRSFPRNARGARTHRADLPGWREQIWVDCMNSEAPFLARLGAVTGEEEYFDQAADELTTYARLLQDERGGLFYHGFEAHCGVNGQLWARGNGWALMGLTEVLSLLPAAHAHRRELNERLLALCRGLLAHQHRDGLWHTVITAPETYLESTLAVMAARSLRRAFETKLLEPNEFADMERRARRAATASIAEDGTLNLVSDATPIGELKMYATRPFGCYPWGQGALLLMLCDHTEED